jgi:hypothetical protein
VMSTGAARKIDLEFSSFLPSFRSFVVVVCLVAHFVDRIGLTEIETKRAGAEAPSFIIVCPSLF